MSRRLAAPARSSLAVVALAAGCLLCARPAEAQAGLRVFEVERVRVDGAVGDWRDARFVTVGEGPDASMRFALGHDAEGLYLAAQVWDERLVRTPRPGAREDAVILTLAMPAGRRHRGLDFHLFAGVSGRSAATVKVARVGSRRLRPVRGARIVEGPLSRGRGYTLEAFIPFSAIPGGQRWDQARASVRLRDVDSEAHPEIESEAAFVEVDPRHLDRLVPLRPSGGASGALEQFLSERGIAAARPAHDLRGDVAGDARPERVFVVDRYVVISGPGYRDGSGYGYRELAVGSASDVRSARLQDLTGDGKAELVVVLRQRNPQGERDLWQVLQLSGRAPRTIFAIEVRKALGGGEVEARVRVGRSRGRRPPPIEVRAGRARGLDADSYRESPADDAEPMLLPWGPVLARSYRWNGSRFERTRERANPRYRPPSEQAPQRTASRAQPAEPEPAQAQAPGQQELLAEYRRRAGIRRGARPRFVARANLAGGREPETALVYGHRLVVVGPDVQQGRSWLDYQVPVERDADLLQMETADVTGDRREEILLRVRQQLGEVQREVLLVHRLTDRGFPRLLQVEVARQQGGDWVRNEVRTGRGRLTIAPGRAHGWGEGRWPFSPSDSDSVEPLLLPWRDRPIRYRYRGGRLVR